MFCVLSVLLLTHCGWELHAVVQIPEPEEVSELMCDVERVELLVSQVQKSQDGSVVLITPAKTSFN